VSEQPCNPSVVGLHPASRHGSARLIAKCKWRRLRTYSKMKELMALAAGLPTIFQDRRTLRPELPALPTRDLVGDEAGLQAGPDDE
jgi:hypothetical protein